MKRVMIFGVVLSAVAAVAFVAAAPEQVEAQSGSRSGSGSRPGGGVRGGSSNQGSGGQRFAQPVQRPARTFEEKFWDFLVSAKYRNWAPVPGHNGEAYEGGSPHGAYLKMYLNRTAAGNPATLPSGSLIVKENFGPDGKSLMAITVMYRSEGYNPEGGDWYWVKYNADGTVAKAPPEMRSMPLAGKPMGCIQCHADGAAGNDFAFFNDDLQAAP